MSEQEKMDHLLHQVMGGIPGPGLPVDFDRKLLKQLRPRRLDSSGRRALIVYALIALVVSISVMREQSIDWTMIAVAVVVPLTVALVIQRRHTSRDHR